MSRECRKCGKIIPNWTKIDRKSVSLRNRKFCLECSPYRNHNTKPDDPARPTIIRTWKNCSEERKLLIKRSSYTRGIKRKIKLIELKGGKCSNCGYNRNLAALCFHHVNPATKSFLLGSKNLHNRRFELLEAEADKCILLCHNCHNEYHHPTLEGLLT